MTNAPDDLRVTDVADVEAQLAEFWRHASTEDQAVVRACTLNLVVTCVDREAVTAATRTIALLSEQHPARALVICAPSPEAESVRAPEDRLDAYVSTHCHLGSGGDQVCSEQINLEAKGRGVELVPETVLQLLVEDTPVYAWWRRTHLAADVLWAPLARLSDRIIVDSATFADPEEALHDLAALAANRAWRGSAGDLAWVRLEPWREAIASMFDGAMTRAYLATVESVRVSAGGPASVRGATAAGAYLVGWLASRLGWYSDDRGVLRRTDGGRVCVAFDREDRLESGGISGVRLQASRGDRTATFVFDKETPEGNTVRIRMETEGTCALPYRHMIAGLDEIELLCGELERDAHDPVFETALAAAARIAKV